MDYVIIAGLFIWVMLVMMYRFNNRRFAGMMSLRLFLITLAVLMAGILLQLYIRGMGGR